MPKNPMGIGGRLYPPPPHDRRVLKVVQHLWNGIIKSLYRDAKRRYKGDVPTEKLEDLISQAYRIAWKRAEDLGWIKKGKDGKYHLTPKGKSKTSQIKKFTFDYYRFKREGEKYIKEITKER